MVVVLLLAACGGNGEESTAPAGGTQAATQTPAESPATTPAATEEPGGDGGQVSGEIDPCDLVTQEEAETLVGHSLPEPDKRTVGPFDSCMYSGASLVDLVQVQVGSDVWSESEFDDSMVEGAKMFDIEAKPVSGLGDKAYWLEGILWVLKGDVAFNLMVSNAELTDPEKDDEVLQQEALAVTTDLAKKVLERLP